MQVATSNPVPHRAQLGPPNFVRVFTAYEDDGQNRRRSGKRHGWRPLREICDGLPSRLTVAPVQNHHGPRVHTTVLLELLATHIDPAEFAGCGFRCLVRRPCAARIVGGSEIGGPAAHRGSRPTPIYVRLPRFASAGHNQL